MAGGLGWASGDLGFVGGGEGRRLQASGNPSVNSLGNTILTTLLAVIAITSLQALAVWYWRNRANKNYSPGVMGVGGQGTFSPWPKFLVWPSPLLFVLLMFAKGLTQGSVTCIVDSTSGGGGTFLGLVVLFLTVGLYVFLVVDMIRFRKRTKVCLERLEVMFTLCIPLSAMKYTLRCNAYACSRGSRGSLLARLAAHVACCYY